MAGPLGHSQSTGSFIGPLNNRRLKKNTNCKQMVIKKTENWVPQHNRHTIGGPIRHCRWSNKESAKDTDKVS